MSEQKPNEIRELKGVLIDTCIALLNIDPVGGTFAIDHAFHIGFAESSARVISGDLMPYARTLIETIMRLRDIDPNAKLIVDDSFRIAARSTFTPKSAA